MCVHERLLTSLCLIVSFFLRNLELIVEFSDEYVHRSIPAGNGEGTTALQSENGGTVIPLDANRVPLREVDDSAPSTLACTGTSIRMETYEFTGNRDEQLKEACALSILGDFFTSQSACKVAEFLPGIEFDQFGRIEKGKLEKYRESEAVQEIIQKLENYTVAASGKKDSLSELMRTSEEMYPFFFRRHANSRRTRFQPLLLPESFVSKVRENSEVMSQLLSNSILAGDEGDINVNDDELKKLLCAKGTDIRDQMTRSAIRLLNNAILALVRILSSELRKVL